MTVLHLPWGEARIGGGPPILTAVTEAEADYLRQHAADGYVLEVGSAFGYSAIAMAQTAKHVVAVDPHAGENPGSLESMRANLRAYGVAEKVTIVVGYSDDVLPLIRPQQFDLIFIDGCHEEAAVLRDVRNATRLLAPAGVLACHDYNNDICRDVSRALDQLNPPDEAVDSLWISRSSSLR